MKIRRVDRAGEMTTSAEVEFELHELKPDAAIRLLGKMMGDTDAPERQPILGPERRSA